MIHINYAQWQKKRWMACVVFYVPAINRMISFLPLMNTDHKDSFDWYLSTACANAAVHETPGQH